MFNKFVALISTVTTVTAVTFCFSVTPALANRVKVVRNCAAFNPDTGVQLRGTAPFGMFNLAGYYRARNGKRMVVLRLWDNREQRPGIVAISIDCLESNRKGVVEYP
jgi:hypothetical protein